MKKFFLISAFAIAIIIIAFLTAFIIQNKMLCSVVNGVMTAIAIIVLFRKLNKINEQESYDGLLKTSKRIMTTNASERKHLIEKQSLSWHDMCTISNGIGSILQISDLRDVLVGKQMPSFVNLITVSDIKKQVTWTGFVGDMLQDINGLVDKTYDDEVITILVSLIKDFEDFLATKSDYYGTMLLIEYIQEKTLIIQRLIKKSPELQ